MNISLINIFPLSSTTTTTATTSPSSSPTTSTTATTTASTTPTSSATASPTSTQTSSRTTSPTSTPSTSATTTTTRTTTATTSPTRTRSTTGATTPTTTPTSSRTTSPTTTVTSSLSTTRTTTDTTTATTSRSTSRTSTHSTSASSTPTSSGSSSATTTGTPTRSSTVTTSPTSTRTTSLTSSATTTSTSTPTTSPTTSQTTTFFHGGVQCKGSDNSSPQVLTVPPSRSCGAQAAALTRVLRTCDKGQGPAKSIVCDTDTIPGSAALSGSQGCTAIAAGINAALLEFRGPGVQALQPVKCGFQDVLYVAEQCSGVAAALNDVAVAVAEGHFSTCLVSTPTTTQSTTQSTSLTSTPTSTPPQPAFVCREKYDSFLLSTASIEECNPSVAWLEKVFGHCDALGGSVPQIECAIEGGDAVLSVSSGCAQAAQAVNYVVSRFNLPLQHTEDVVCAHSRYLADSTSCDATAAALNNAIVNYADGTFAGCRMTTVTTTPTTSLSSTPTTTPTITASTPTTTATTTTSATSSPSTTPSATPTTTTTPTTTATSSQTTTATTTTSATTTATTSTTPTTSATTGFETGMLCTDDAPQVFAVRQPKLCAAHVAALTAILEDCEPGLDVNIACDYSAPMPFLQDTANCSAVSGALGRALDEFRGPGAGVAAEDFGCAFGRYLYDPSNCSSTAHELNSMISAFRRGTFQNCQVTTPTTSRTTTATSSPTTTPTTTTATTSPTTSPTATLTTTGTATPTRSATSSRTTTATTSTTATTTATSSRTTSATTSRTTSPTTTRTITASSSRTTSATTSPTSTPTATPGFGIYSFVPANNSRGAAAGTSIVVTFAGVATPGRGNSSIYLTALPDPDAEATPLAGSNATAASHSGTTTAIRLSDASQVAFGVADASSSQPGFAHGTLTITPTHPFASGQAGTYYRLTASPGALVGPEGSESDVLNGASYVFHVADLAAPHLVRSDPADLATDVPLDAAFTFEFDEAVTVAPGSVATFTAAAAAGSGSTQAEHSCNATAALAGARTRQTLLLQPAPVLSSGVEYTLVLHTGAFEDISSNPAPAIVLTFVAKDTLPPTIVGVLAVRGGAALAPLSSSPASISSGISYLKDTTISVTFNEPVMRGVSGNFSLTRVALDSNGTAVAQGAISFQPAFPFVRFNAATMKLDLAHLYLQGGEESASYVLGIATGAVADQATGGTNPYAGSANVATITIDSSVFTPSVQSKACAAGMGTSLVFTLSARAALLAGDAVVVSFPRHTGFAPPNGLLGPNDVSVAGERNVRVTGSSTARTLTVLQLGGGGGGGNGNGNGAPLEFELRSVKLPRLYGTTGQFTFAVRYTGTRGGLNSQVFSPGIAVCNAHPPTFVQDVFRAAVPETRTALPSMAFPPISVTTVTAVDPDSLADTAVSYALVASRPSSGMQAFAINTLTGGVSLTAAQDYDTDAAVHQYQLTVQATEASFPFAASNATLLVNITDINDHPPTFRFPDPLISYYSSIVHEVSMQPGAVVMTALAEDADDGANAQLVYTLTQVSGGNDFTIDAATGVVSAARAMTRLETPHVVVSINASDSPDDSADTLSSRALMSINLLSDNYLIRAQVSLDAGQATLSIQRYSQFMTAILCAGQPVCLDQVVVFNTTSAGGGSITGSTADVAGAGTGRTRGLDDAKDASRSRRSDSTSEVTTLHFYVREKNVRRTVPVAIKLRTIEDVLRALKTPTAARMLNDSNIGFKTMNLAQAVSRPKDQPGDGGAPTSSSSKLGTGVLIAIVVASFFGCMLFFCLCLYAWERRSNEQQLHEINSKWPTAWTSSTEKALVTTPFYFDPNPRPPSGVSKSSFDIGAWAPQNTQTNRTFQAQTHYHPAGPQPPLQHMHQQANRTFQAQSHYHPAGPQPPLQHMHHRSNVPLESLAAAGRGRAAHGMRAPGPGRMLQPPPMPSDAYLQIGEPGHSNEHNMAPQPTSRGPSQQYAGGGVRRGSLEKHVRGGDWRQVRQMSGMVGSPHYGALGVLHEGDSVSKHTRPL